MKRRKGSGILKEEKRTNVFFFSFSAFLSLSHTKLSLSRTDDNTTKQLSLNSVLRIMKQQCILLEDSPKLKNNTGERKETLPPPAEQESR